MELSRRDFMRNTAAFAAVASVLGTSGIAFAADADQNCLVKVDSPDRAELAKRFKAGSAAGVEYYAYNPRRYAPALKGKLPLIVSSTVRTVWAPTAPSLPPTTVPPSTFLTK